MKKGYYIAGCTLLLLIVIFWGMSKYNLPEDRLAEGNGHEAIQAELPPVSLQLTPQPAVESSQSSSNQTVRRGELNPYEKTLSVNYAWGESLKNFGLQQSEHHPPEGPHTFALDRRGKLHVLDHIKGKVRVFDETGQQQTSNSFSGSGADIAIGDNGEIFSLEQNHLLVSSSSGSITLHELSAGIPLIEGVGQGMQFDDAGNLYVCKFQQCHQVGAVLNGEFTLLSPEEQTANVKPGYPIKNDQYVRTEWIDEQNAVIKIMDRTEEVIQEIRMITPDTFGAVLFRKQDKAGHLYVELERISSDNYVHLEVWKFHEDGKLLSVTEIPNEYYTSVYKAIEIDEEGIIHQIITTPEGVKLLTWKP